MNTSGYDLRSFDLSNIFKNYDIIDKGAAYELISPIYPHLLDFWLDDFIMKDFMSPSWDLHYTCNDIILYNSH